MPRAASAHSIDTLLARRVQRATRGTVFTPASFASLGSRAAIDKALQRQVMAGHLRRLSRGLYDKPRQHELFGTLWPSVDAVVRALTGKDRIRTQPTGAYAANLLGLSEQVPAKVVLLTDGTARSVQVGALAITLKRTTPRDMATAGRLSGLVIQAFKSLGAAHITAERIQRLRETLPQAERSKLLRDVALAPAWMQPHLRALALDDSLVK